MMPEHTKGVFDGYSAYWRKAPEGFEKQNMMQIFEAWGADRTRIEALEMELAEKRVEIYDGGYDTLEKERGAHCAILEAENRILMGKVYPFSGFCCGLRDMGPGIHEAGCEIAAALAAEKKPVCDCLPGHICDVHRDREKW
jgi:hypothetical protein